MGHGLWEGLSLGTVRDRRFWDYILMMRRLRGWVVVYNGSACLDLLYLVVGISHIYPINKILYIILLSFTLQPTNCSAPRKTSSAPNNAHSYIPDTAAPSASSSSAHCVDARAPRPRARE